MKDQKVKLKLKLAGTPVADSTKVPKRTSRTRKRTSGKSDVGSKDVRGTLRRTRAGHDPYLTILAALALFSVTFYGFLNDWPQLRSIDVRGNASFTDNEIISLAALDDFSDAWAISIPGRILEKNLEANPLIESARISLTGPCSLRIRVTERQPLAAVNYNGTFVAFDRSGTFVNFLGSSESYDGTMVEGIPLGLLKYDGRPLRTFGKIWELPAIYPPADVMDVRFNRLMDFVSIVKHDYGEQDFNLEKIALDEEGGVVAVYENCPPFILGSLSNTELQYRRIVAMLSDGRFLDPEKISDIDLSSERFPCYHVREDYLTAEEKAAIAQWEKELSEGETDPDEPVDNSTSQDEGGTVDSADSDSDEDKPTHDTNIFDLGSR